jgi:hypothetical protein
LPTDVERNLGVFYTHRKERVYGVKTGFLNFSIKIQGKDGKEVSLRPTFENPKTKEKIFGLTPTQGKGVTSMKSPPPTG